MKNYEKWWANKKIDWNKNYWTPRHLHRILILREILRFPFKSVFEIGCGAGANLANIHNVFKGSEVGGTDINPEAIETAKKNLPYAKDLEIGTADDIFFSDKSIDILISDAVLFYVSPFKINKVIQEMARVARNGIILCELWSPSILKRIKLWLKERYFAHNYLKLFKKYGFYDIKITKILEKNWPDSLWIEYGYIVSARI